MSDAYSWMHGSSRVHDEYYPGGFAVYIDDDEPENVPDEWEMDDYYEEDEEDEQDESI